jgi:uncharacterized Zn finger protein
MSKTTVAPPVRERVLRGIALHAGDEVEAIGHGRYEVAGSKGWTYRVDLDIFADDPRETCSCPDYRRHSSPCKHVYSAAICRAKTRAASRRGERPKMDAEAVEANLARMGA